MTQCIVPRIQKMKIFTKLLALILIMLSACTLSPQDHPVNIRVISLKRALPDLVKKAAEWHSDAYLVDVHISLDDRDNDQIIASFRSPSEDHEILGVTYHLNGSISVEYFKTVESILQLKPIRDSDWKIDSQAALNIMLSDQDIGYIVGNENAKICSTFMLFRDPYLPDRQVVWHLSLWNCQITKEKHINSSSGTDYNRTG